MTPELEEWSKGRGEEQEQRLDLASSNETEDEMRDVTGKEQGHWT